MLPHVRVSHGDTSRVQAARPNLTTLLTLGLLCVNTLILLSDHRWLTDNRWLKQAVHTVERAGEISQAAAAAAGSAAQAASVGVIVGSSDQAALLSGQRQFTLAALDPLMDLFQQSRRCNRSPFMQQYRQLHSRIMRGEAPPRYLVSVAPETDMADRLTGLVTQFYIALLSGRALTAYHPDPDAVPPFSAACDYPLFNWTHPQELPPPVYEPLLIDEYANFEERRNASQGLLSLPAPYKQEYQLFNLVNTTLPMMSWLGADNLTAWPQDRPELSHVVIASNRGATWKLASNPYHSDDFWRLGARPEDAFMCGFWALCRPNEQVQRLYAQDVWAPLADPHALKIGIEVHFGDEVLNTYADRADDPYVSSLMTLATPFFECAADIESAYSVPGQQVVWYLVSDSSQFRRAAKQQYGDKLLTDTELTAAHSSCRASTSTARRRELRSYNGTCSPEPTQRVMRRAVGSMLALSLADFHVMTKASGLGRLAAALSGKWDNMHELKLKLGDSRACEAYSGAHPMMVALHGAGV